MRLFDIMSAGFPNVEEHLPGFKTATVVDISLVHRWIGETFPLSGVGSEVAIPYRELSRSLPPFATTWFEWSYPQIGTAAKVGVLVTREEMLTATLENEYKVTLSPYASWKPDRADDRLTWRGSLNPIVVYLNAEGAICRANEWLHGLHDKGRSSARFFAGLMPTIMLACRFTNARGVILRERSPNRQERRSAERSGTAMPTKYYTLDIRPITHRLETEGRVKEVGLMRALHLCRGHFADYTQGAGLFGKYKTEVFVPEHVRGSRERGEIVKDYSVKP